MIRTFISRMSSGMLLIAVLCACGPTTDNAIPQDPQAGGATSQAAPRHKAPKPLKVSACNQAREAFLTGTKADQRAALQRLQADRKADATAREYAKYWLVRDKSNPDLREMDETLIVSACS